MNNHDKRDINRRSFLKIFGGGAAITAAAMSGLDVNATERGGNASADNTKGKMTYRKSKSGKDVSISRPCACRQSSRQEICSLSLYFRSGCHPHTDRHRMSLSICGLLCL